MAVNVGYCSFALVILALCRAPRASGVVRSTLGCLPRTETRPHFSASFGVFLRRNFPAHRSVPRRALTRTWLVEAESVSDERSISTRQYFPGFNRALR